jgi:hypothetical protein
MTDEPQGAWPFIIIFSNLLKEKLITVTIFLTATAIVIIFLSDLIKELLIVIFNKTAIGPSHADSSVVNGIQDTHSQ